MSKLNGLAFHDLLALFDVVLLAVLNDLPELVRDDIGTLMELVLGLIIFPKVRVFIREIVEILNELLQDFLFIVETVQVFKEAFLNIGVFNLHLFSVKAHISEDSGHLILVVLAHVLPDTEDNRLEDSLNVVTTRGNGSDSRCSANYRSASILNHGLG